MKCIKNVAFACALAPTVSAAHDGNVFMGATENQLSLSGGYAIGNTSPESRNGMITLRYSQPTTIFKLSARQNLQAGHVVSTSDAWSFAGFSMDVAPVNIGRLYVGAGLGGYIRTAQTPRLGSRFTFGERIFIGYKFNKRFSTELYIQHFSNGDLTKENAGYNFAGVSANISF